jgi:hypothetical protein
MANLIACWKPRTGMRASLSSPSGTLYTCDPTLIIRLQTMRLVGTDVSLRAPCQDEVVVPNDRDTDAVNGALTNGIEKGCSMIPTQTFAFTIRVIGVRGPSATASSTVVVERSVGTECIGQAEARLIAKA